MRTEYLLAVAYPLVALLGFGPDVPGLSAALCLAAVAVTGELWLRALISEPIRAGARLGLVTAAGLVTLPLVTLALHTLGVRIEPRALAVGLAVVVTVLGALALVRRPPVVAGRAVARTLTAVAVPAVLSLLIGGAAAITYVRLPHPPEPGYTSLALAGWAAQIRHPVTFPAGGLDVPLQVSSAGEPPVTAALRVQVGGRLIGVGQPMAIAADATRSVRVHVPAPPNGCPHLIRISLGTASTVFYGRGPAAVSGRGPAAGRPSVGSGRVAAC